MKNRLGQELRVGDIIAKSYKTSCGVDLKIAVVEEIVTKVVDRWGRKHEASWARVRTVLDPSADREFEYDDVTGHVRFTHLKAVGKVTKLLSSNWVRLGHRDTLDGQAMLERFAADNAASDKEQARLNEERAKQSRALYLITGSARIRIS